ncbi:hypothetical protein LCGC14_1569980, partial [marine sediment metagenome]
RLRLGQMGDAEAEEFAMSQLERVEAALTRARGGG